MARRCWRLPTTSNGRVWPGNFSRLHNKLHNSLRSLGRSQHFETAHILASSSLGEQLKSQGIARNYFGVKDRRRVVTRILSQDGIAGRKLA